MWNLSGAACALSTLLATLLATFAAAGTPAFAQSAAGQGATSRAKAVILAPLTLANTAPLVFGDISAGATAGTVVVSPQGVRTRTGGATLLGGTVTSAGFSGTATRNGTIFVRVVTNPVVLTRIGGGATMRVTGFTLGGTQFQTTGDGRGFVFRIGGTLQVGAGQADGEYEGNFDVSVDYQ